MLGDPLTGVPAGLLTIETVNWLLTSEKYQYSNNWPLEDIIILIKPITLSMYTCGVVAVDVSYKYHDSSI